MEGETANLLTSLVSLLVKVLELRLIFKYWCTVYKKLKIDT